MRSLFKALQGMVENAKKPPGIKDWEEENSDLATPSRSLSAKFVTVNTVDYTNKDVRLLLTLSNFAELKATTIPQLISQFETAFSIKLIDENKVSLSLRILLLPLITQTVRDAVSQIDVQLFDEYTKPRTKHIQSLVRNGILSPDWGKASHPTDVKPYVYTSLLSLVLVHAQVSVSAPSLLQSIISYLFEATCKEILETLKGIPRFSIGHLLQATLDVEFVNQTLSSFATDRSKELQQAIYVELDRGSDAESRNGLQKELSGLKGTLSNLRKNSRAEL